MSGYSRIWACRRARRRAHRRGRWRCSGRPDPQSTSGSEARPNRREAGDPARPAPAQPAKCVHISRRGPMQGTKNPRERGKFSSNTVRLTVCWAGNIVADREKGRLNFLFAPRSSATNSSHLPDRNRRSSRPFYPPPYGGILIQVKFVRLYYGNFHAMRACIPNAPLP